MWTLVAGSDCVEVSSKLEEATAEGADILFLF